MVVKITDKKTIAKAFRILARYADEGQIASLTAIGRWVRINPSNIIIKPAMEIFKKVK